MDAGSICRKTYRELLISVSKGWWPDDVAGYQDRVNLIISSLDHPKADGAEPSNDDANHIVKSIMCDHIERALLKAAAIISIAETHMAEQSISQRSIIQN